MTWVYLIKEEAKNKTLGNNMINLKVFNKKRLGGIPGANRYTGEYTKTPLSIDSFIYNIKDYKNLKCEGLPLPKSLKSTHWYNIVGLNHEDFLNELGDAFNIHPMHLEDLCDVNQPSKIEITNDYLFATLKMVYLKDNKIHKEHVSCILKENTCITFQETPGDVFDEIRGRIINDLGRIRSMSSDYLFFSIIDAITDAYYPVIHHLYNHFHQIESQVNQEKTINNKLYHYRRNLILYNSIISPLKRELEHLLKTNPIYIEDTRDFFNDSLDQMEEIDAYLKELKEMSGHLNEMLMNNMSHQMNQTMLILTIFSAVFIPLSFLAGVFGMNFVNMPILMMENGFSLFILSSIIITIIMFSFFKYKKLF